ncbi:hypothetical protein UFOVP802_3 [uncultured Caudovirales phage]|uniref:Uncharacterized protein n=1 Tax=uncultured Caudovirales phage TaxID=2100421 RepID=A0A6J5NWC7_9CAUD|nr:hypothetical protein UFOVP802_3 [uncultured Caudovirales phage]
MATTSPIYGWPEPTSSDYVKNGATAITAMGNAIENTVYSIDVRVTAAEDSIAALINPFLLMGA